MNYNKLNLKRTIPTISIPFEDIICPDGIAIDQNYVKKYTNFISGKKVATLTRVFIDEIKIGMYLRESGVWKEYVNQSPRGHIDQAKIQIRSGVRPLLSLCKNINRECNKKYTCPDGYANFIAYKELGIKYIPAMILDSNSKLEESAFLIESINHNRKLAGQFITSIKIINNDSVYSLLLGSEDLSPIEKIGLLINKCVQVMEVIKKFDQDSSVDIHYNHTMFSIVYRLKENLCAIRMLIESKYYYQSVGLLRSVYELSLDFYLDWLSPEQVGHWLQLRSQIRQSHFNELVEEIIKEESKEIKSKSFQKVLTKKRSFMYNFLGNVSNKADMSPLGMHFYDSIYRYSSEIIHQDFSMTQRHATLFDNPSETLFNNSSIVNLIKCLDYITAKVVFRVLDDFGASEF